MCPICGTTYGSEIAFCQTDGTKLMDAVEAQRMRTDPDPLVRSLIGGRYRVIKRIGEGGMGIVYLAEHEAIEKRVAVKVLKEQYAQREDVVRRFQQEAKSASRVKHEGVLEVFDFGRTEDGRFFLAMELLDGTDLAHLLDREGVIEPNRAARLSIKMARALGAAHAKGVIHRDMKPENVFVRLGDDGREHIKIVDFGIAQLRADGESDTNPEAKIQVRRKLTKTGMIFGTPEYMSPEQAAGKNIDARIDVYALGIIMFEMLAGKTPFQGDTFMAILSSHLLKPIPAIADEAPQGFHCSSDFEAIVRRALAKDPAGRFASMQELVDALLMTPEGMSDESIRRPSYAPSSQFPSGMLGQPVQMTPTEVRLRSNAPPGFQGAPTIASGENPIVQVRAPATTDIAMTVSPKKSGGALIFGGLVMVLGVMGIAGWLGWRYLANTEAKTATTSTPTTAPTRSVESNEPLPSASTIQVPVVPTPSTSASSGKLVTIHVESTPSGALVEREIDKEWHQVCDTTPCDVAVPPGSALHLRAVKGGVSVEKRLLADHDQKAQLTLAPTGTTPPPPKADAGAKQDICEVLDESGIKVWRPCPKK